MMYSGTSLQQASKKRPDFLQEREVLYLVIYISNIYATLFLFNPPSSRYHLLFHPLLSSPTLTSSPYYV